MLDVSVVVLSSSGDVVLRRTLGTENGEPVSFRSGFAPDEYTVSASCEELTASVAFGVDAGASDAPPVRLRLWGSSGGVGE